MKIVTGTISVETLNPIDIIDVTDQIKQTVSASGLRQGTVTIISRHTTAYVNINEKETRLLEDMVTFLKRLVPKDGDYLHNLAPIDDRHNAHAHLMGLFMNSSESIPFADGKLLLGEWQSIFFVELDGPRNKRSLLVQITGE